MNESLMKNMELKSSDSFNHFLERKKEIFEGANPASHISLYDLALYSE